MSGEGGLATGVSGRSDRANVLASIAIRNLLVALNLLAVAAMKLRAHAAALFFLDFLRDSVSIRCCPQMAAC